MNFLLINIYDSSMQQHVQTKKYNKDTQMNWKM